MAHIVFRQGGFHALAFPSLNDASSTCLCTLLIKVSEKNQQATVTLRFKLESHVFDTDQSINLAYDACNWKKGSSTCLVPVRVKAGETIVGLRIFSGSEGVDGCKAWCEQSNPTTIEQLRVLPNLYKEIYLKHDELTLKSKKCIEVPLDYIPIFPPYVAFRIRIVVLPSLSRASKDSYLRDSIT